MLGIRSLCAKESRLAAASRRQRRFESLEPRQMLSATPPTVAAVHLSGTDWSPAYVAHLQDAGLGDHGFRIPTGSADQLAPVPWTNVDQISITFSEDVCVQQNDLALSSASALSYEFSRFQYDPQMFVATWTLTASLTPDAYRIDLDGDGVGKILGQWTGLPLDGEWSDGVSTVSGDGTAGGDFEFQFRVLPGDADRSGSVGWTDWYGTYTANGSSIGDASYVALRDFDGSATIDAADVSVAELAYGDAVETAAPLGTWNDAPSAKSISTKKIPDPSTTTSVSLFAAYSDSEDNYGALQWTIDNSHPSLFDTFSFNPSTGSISISGAAGESGRAEVRVTATDSYGMSTTQSFFIDVAYVDQAPWLTFSLSYQAEDIWSFGGTVADTDDVVDGMYVYIYGAVQMRAAVRADGTWEFATPVDPADWGKVTAITIDFHGALSNVEEAMVGW